MPNLTGSFTLNNLQAGTPLYINYTLNSGSYYFSWVNYKQSTYQSTLVTANGKTIYQGTGSSFVWVPNLTANTTLLNFYTVLSTGIKSTPEANSIINLGSISNQTGVFSKLWYGYSCANNGDYIAIGCVNTNDVYSLAGTVDILKYNATTNTYENSFVIKKIPGPQDYALLLTTEDNTLDVNGNPFGNAYLTTELSSSYLVNSPIVLGTDQLSTAGVPAPIETEAGSDLYVSSSFVPLTYDPMNIEVDSVFNLISSYNDNFGKSLTLNGNILAVGYPNSTTTFVNNQSYTFGGVDIFDLSTWVAGLPYYPTVSLSVSGDPTFGESVSLSQVSGTLYLAIGSSLAYNGYGVVYIYQRNDGDNANWTLAQTLYGPSPNTYFGGTVRFEQSGLNYTLVVGNSNYSNSATQVSIYSYSNGQWSWNTTLHPDNTIAQTLPYLNNLPPVILPNSCDGFGNSVALYGNNLIVGAPTDTLYTEFGGGSTKTRGAVYFYTSCTNLGGGASWQFIQKNWGDANTLVNNNLGYAVDMADNLAVVTVPKNNITYTKNYILNTLNKRLNCNPDDSYYDTLGQVVLYNYNLSASHWTPYYTQQKTKDYAYPYLNYASSVALCNQTFVVGAPCNIVDFENLTVNFPPAIQGYSYIYNLNNLISNCPVGNVFYRDGKIILSNSGSIFGGLLKNKYDSRFATYDLSYKGTLKLYEKTIVCTINPGEFNYSTNPTAIINKAFFNFKDVDFVLKYINYTLTGNYNWWNYLNFNVVEQSLFNFYTETYDILNSSILPYQASLSSSHASWDVDGNNKINLKDMTLIWKYFTNTLTQNDVFNCVEPKSLRKTLTDIQNYIANNIVTRNYGEINPQFFSYDYSSSFDPTGSYLAPYITSIGLYSGADLVATAKLAKPVKNGGEFPLNILVKWDI
jgi:hypothetical protein